MNHNLRFASAAIVLIIGSAGLTGCHERARAQRAFDRRVAGLEHTLGVIARSEAERPDKLARVGPYVRREWQDDRDKFERSVLRTGDLMRRDMQRFEDRLPWYEETVERALRGKPERIERTAIDLFY